MTLCLYFENKMEKESEELKREIIRLQERVGALQQENEELRAHVESASDELKTTMSRTITRLENELQQHAQSSTTTITRLENELQQNVQHTTTTVSRLTRENNKLKQSFNKQIENLRQEMIEMLEQHVCFPLTLRLHCLHL